MIFSLQDIIFVPTLLVAASCRSRIVLVTTALYTQLRQTVASW